MAALTKDSSSGAMGHILTVPCTVTGGLATRVTLEMKTVLDFETIYGTTNRAPMFVSISVRDPKVGPFLAVVPILSSSSSLSSFICLDHR